MQLPNKNGDLVNIADSILPQAMIAQLSYSPIPLLLTLKNNNEVFVNSGTRVIPLNLFYAGSLLGLFETMDFLYGQVSKPKWSVSAGSRTLLMLPKISDRQGINRLNREFNLPSTTRLKCMADHWPVCKAIAQHHAFSQPWDNEVLFFTLPWLKPNKNSLAWERFHRYLFQESWKQVQFSLGKIELSAHWKKFSEAIAIRNLKPRPYLVEQVKHILAIGSGKLPGMRPITDEQKSVPLAGLQKVFVDVYSLKEYLPTFLHACSLDNIFQSLPVYYSLGFPTLLEGSDLNKTSTTRIVDLIEIKTILDTMRKHVAADPDSIIKQMDLAYFHTETQGHPDILQSSTITNDDPALLYDQKHYFKRIFCHSSPFWRGCIRISRQA
jgi:hypothetical protein